MRLKMTRPLRARRCVQRGLTLIESLCAIVIMAVGMLGILGMQMRTLTDTTTSVRRAQAIRMIEDLGERMRTNPNALMNMDRYALDWAEGDSLPLTARAAKTCDTQSCSNTELADYDIREWKRAVELTLPSGNAATFIPLPERAANNTEMKNRRQLGVLIGWKNTEREDTDLTFAHAIDAGTSRKANGEKLDTDPQACPAGFSCHLQYVAVSARCSADLRRGAGAPQFFCSGS